MRQISVPLRHVRAALTGAGTVVTVLVLAAVTQFATLPRVLSHDALVGENLTLRARLDHAEGQLEEVAGLVQRVRVYDEHLRSLDARNSIPGFGPLDGQEQAARTAWIDGTARLDAADEVPSSLRPDERGALLAARADALAAELEGLVPVLDGLGSRLDALEAVRGVLPVMWPVELDAGVITSNWGWRHSPFGREWKFHAGIDIGADYGTPILATNDGLVVYAGWENGYGLMVDVDHGGGVLTRYGHAARLLVEPGDAVTAGDVIALVGSTGRSTGPHLHYELRFDGESVEPLEYLP